MFSLDCKTSLIYYWKTMQIKDSAEISYKVNMLCNSYSALHGGGGGWGGPGSHAYL